MNLSAEALSDEWDDLSNLGADDWGVLKDWEGQFTLKYTRVGWLEKEPGKDFTKDDSTDQPAVVKEVESIGPNQKGDTIDDPLKDSHPQNGDQVDESQTEETKVQDNSNDQTEADQGSDQEADQDSDDQEADQGNNDQEVDQGSKDQEVDQGSNNQEQQDQTGQSPEAKEEESELQEDNQELIVENQEGDKNEGETSQGDQEQDENSV